MEDVVIVAGVRTPVGKFQGTLSTFSAVQLGSLVVREVLNRAQLNPEQVDECIMGNVVSAGLGQNPARQARDLWRSLSLGQRDDHQQGLRLRAEGGGTCRAGDPDRQCRDCDCRRYGIDDQYAPTSFPRGRSGFRMGNATVVDSMIHDGLWEIYNDYHMGVTGEHVAESMASRVRSRSICAQLASQGSRGLARMLLAIPGSPHRGAREEEGRRAHPLRP